MKTLNRCRSVSRPAADYCAIESTAPSGHKILNIYACKSVIERGNCKLVREKLEAGCWPSVSVDDKLSSGLTLWCGSENELED